MIWKIAKAELQTLFFSPLAWLMLVVLGIFVFGVFYDKYDLLVRSIAIGDTTGHLTRTLYIGQQGIYLAILDTLYCFFPLLTMGLISRELSSGSIKLLDSSPVSTAQIVLGKYISMCVFSLLLLFVLFLPVVLGWLTVENLEIKAIFTGLLGIYLLMCTYSAIGLFMSSLSIYPIIAAVGTFGVLAALNMIGKVGLQYEFIRDITNWCAINQRIMTFLHGIIASSDVAYYVLIIVYALALTWLKLRFSKLSWSWWKKGSVYGSITVALLLFGYVSSRPMCKFFLDGTEDKRHTLTEASQEIMKKLKKKEVKVTTLVNILHKNSSHGSPRNILNENALLGNYVRFLPQMELEYRYYYGKTSQLNQSAQVYMPMAGIDSTVVLISRFEGLKPSDIHSLEEMRKLYPFVDFAAEDCPVIKVVEADGKYSLLRYFNDNSVVPSEAEISASFKRITDGWPVVVFLAGHGSLDITSRKNEGYNAIFNTGSIRASFINQGWDVREVRAEDGKLPENTALLVIANPLETYSERALKMVHDYIASGGNLFVMGDADNEANVNKLLSPLGVQLASGYLVEPHAENEPLPHVVTARPLQSAVEISPSFAHWQPEYAVAMKMATAIGVDTLSREYEFIPLLASGANSWLKTEKVNLLEGRLEPDASKGERAMPYVTAAALRRLVGEKEQRVVVTSDADWLTNIGLSTQYPGVVSNSAGFAYAVMSWLVYDEAPVKMEREDVKDYVLHFQEENLPWIYYIYVWILPLLMAIGGYVLYYRRNKE